MNWDDSNLPEQWTKFRRHAELMFTGPLKAKTEEEKVSYLLLWIGDKGREVRQTWTDITDDNAKLLKTFYDRYKEHVQPTLNPIFARYQFNNEVQGSESVDAFLTRLRLKARDCEFGDSADEMIRDRIVFGTNSNKIREKLINVGRDLTLTKAIQISQSYEYSREQLKEMSKTETVHHIKSKKTTKPGTPTKATTYRQQQHTGAIPKKGKYQRHKQFQKLDVDKCANCGYEHTQKQPCPAKGKKCRNCDKLNHFKSVCRSQRVHEVYINSDSDSDDSTTEDFFVCTVGKSFSQSNDQAFATVNVGPKEAPIRFKLDTGSQVNILPTSIFRELQLKHPLEVPDSKLSSYSGDRLNVTGTCQLPVQCNDNHLELTFYIVETNASPLLSLNACLGLGLIQLIYAVNDQQAKCEETQNETGSRSHIFNEFSEVFKGIGLLPGSVKLHLKPDAIPVVNPPRRVPVAFRDRLKEELTRMEKQNIIAKVTTPTDWVNSLVVVEKPKTKKLRVCLDPKALNDAIRRPYYPMRTLDEVVSQLAGATYFSVLDAASGYWSLKLNDVSSYLTTFNTPFGRYRYLRLPFGLNCSQDLFQRKIDECFEGLPGVTAIVDDVLVYGRTKEEHDKHLYKVMTRARDRGIKFNPDKCVIGVKEVSYFGHMLTEHGLKADPKKVIAITQMTAPKNRSELETFLGMVTYLTKFSPHLATITAPLRALLKKDIDFIWDSPQETAFQNVKTALTESPVLAYFDENKPITLQVDASKYGLGCTLMQNGKPTAYASKTLTQTEVGYAQIEKEMLAILFACRRFEQSIYGKRVLVESDHKPLSSIMKKPLCNAPPRLQRMLLQLQKYDLEICFVPGKQIPLADCLSRAFLPDTYPELSDGLDLHIHTILSTIAVSDKKLDQVRQATRNDSKCQTLQKTILDGWPDLRKQCPPSIVEYWNHRDELSVSDDIIFRGQKIIIPMSLRPEMIKIVHSGHMGVEKSVRRARDIMFWPGMTTEITNYILRCEVCLKHRNSNTKQPLKPHEVPDNPFQVIGTDVFTWENKDYLVTVDYFSRYFEVDLLTDTKSISIIRKLKCILARFGVCQKLISDNASYFTSELFQTFANEWGFEHVTSSPVFPQSNGLSEKFVGIVKRIFRKAKDAKTDPYLAILEYRTTPLKCGKSPAQLLMGRRLRSVLPTTNEQLRPREVDIQNIRHKMKENKEVQKKHYDRSAKTLADLNTGDKVRVQFDKQWKPGRIIDKHRDRSYVVQTNDGAVYRRNRRSFHKSKYQSKDEMDILPFDNARPISPDITPQVPQSQISAPQTGYTTRSGRTVVPSKYLSDPVWQK